MSTKDIRYPSIRFIADELKRMADLMQRDLYYHPRLNKSERFVIGVDIQRLRGYVLALLHYAPLVELNSSMYPRTFADIAHELGHLINLDDDLPF